MTSTSFVIRMLFICYIYFYVSSVELTCKDYQNIAGGTYVVNGPYDFHIRGLFDLSIYERITFTSINGGDLNNNGYLAIKGDGDHDVLIDGNEILLISFSDIGTTYIELWFQVSSVGGYAVKISYIDCSGNLQSFINTQQTYGAKYSNSNISQPINNITIQAQSGGVGISYIKYNTISWSNTRNPTYHPTLPTIHPTYNPTKATHSPTQQPTYDPTKATYSPTQQPTYDPTKATYSPTQQPTYHPTNHPTYNPTRQPINYPSYHPTKDPTNHPTYDPTKQPINYPSYHPTKQPTKDPTYDPTRHSTNYPSYWSYHPTKQTTNNPTASLSTTNVLSIMSNKDNSNDESGLIVGVVCGALIFVLIIFSMVFVWSKWKDKEKKIDQQNNIDIVENIKPSAPDIHCIDNLDDIEGAINENVCNYDTLNNKFGEESETFLRGNEGVKNMKFNIEEWFRNEVDLEEYYINLLIQNGFDNIKSLKQITDDDLIEIGITKL
eukprot:4876_1